MMDDAPGAPAVRSGEAILRLRAGDLTLVFESVFSPELLETPEGREVIMGYLSKKVVEAPPPPES